MREIVFATVAPAPLEGWTSGAVLWTVTGGRGTFSDAKGLITSNFTVSAHGCGGRPPRGAPLSDIGE